MGESKGAVEIPFSIFVSPLGSCEELLSRHRRTLRAMALRHAAQRLAQRAAPLAGQAARPLLIPFYRHMASDANLLKTALYDFHLEMGGKMVRRVLACLKGRP